MQAITDHAEGDPQLPAGHPDDIAKPANQVLSSSLPLEHRTQPSSGVAPSEAGCAAIPGHLSLLILPAELRQPTLLQSTASGTSDAAPMPTSEALPRTFTTTGTQAIPEYAVHEVNTAIATFTSTGMSHTDGCWPREIDPTDGEQVARWRKRMERDEDYIRTVLKLGAIVEELVKQNNALDIYQNYFADVVSPSVEPPGVMTLAVLRHPLGLEHSVEAISWRPNGAGHLALSFADGPKAPDSLLNTFASQEKGFISVFDTNAPLIPVCSFTAPSTATCLAYAWKDHSVLGAGMRNGQVCIFDHRQGADPVGQTAALLNHTDTVTGLCWTQCKTGTEFLTGSMDGTVTWWDSRKFSERIDLVQLKEKAAGGAGDGGTAPAADGGLPKPPMPATCLEYSAAAGPAKFMAGTMLGGVFSGNWKAKTPADRISAVFKGHHGPVRAISRHPSLPKYFLSFGDWTARLWAEDTKVALVSTPYRAQYVTGGAWSAHRPAVYYSVCSDGSYEAWDLLHSHKDPVFFAKVADAPLTTFAAEPGSVKGLQAIGTGDGCTYVVQPTGCLVHAVAGEAEAAVAVSCRHGSIVPF